MSQENNFVPEQQAYKNLRPFPLFIKGNFPFIENTFEALDNYGLLCKVIEYLNDVIANENAVTENTQALYNAFVSLNDYVSNYFDNLNVQDEINNKLDEMAEDGTLFSYIRPYFNNYVMPIIEEQNSTIEEQNENIGLLTSRVDNISHLEEGSTSGDAELVDIRTAYNGLIYSNAGNSVRAQIEDCYILKTGKNLFNKNTTNYIEGLYVQYNTGHISPNPDFRIDFIPVKPGSKISINQSWQTVVFTDVYTDVTAFVRDTGIPHYISGVATSSSSANIQVPSNASAVLVSHTISGNDSYQVEYGEIVTEYEDYVIGIEESDIIGKKDKKIINKYVATDNSGDFTSIREAVDYANNLDFEEYNIYIKSGTYDIKSDYTSEEIAAQGFVGLKLPKNVNLIGIGKKRSDVIIKYENELSEQSSEISTLNFTNNNKIENVTVKGNYIRYVVHDDFSDKTFANSKGDIRIVRNCDFIGDMLTYGFVYGAGTKGGANWLFENVRFINKYSSHGFSVHDAYNQGTLSKNEQYHFINCEIIAIGTGENFRISPANSGLEETIIIENCIINNINVSSQYTGGENATTVFNIVGSGNSKNITQTFYNNQNKLSFIKFSDMVNSMFAGESIEIGDYVKISNNLLIVGTQSDNIGVSLTDSNENEICYYKY